MAVSQHATLTDGNGNAILGQKAGEKGELVTLTSQQGRRVAKVLGTFPTAEVKAFARAL